jgi:hypothetical protein
VFSEELRKNSGSLLRDIVRRFMVTVSLNVAELLAGGRRRLRIPFMVL